MEGIEEEEVDTEDPKPLPDVVLTATERKEEEGAPLSEVDLATMPSRRSRGRLKSAQYRKSIDFPTAVMQVARRASAIRGGEVATLSSTPTHDAEQKPENQRKKATVTEPDHAVFRLALPRVTVEGKRSLDASPTSSSSTVNSNAYNNSPHRRRYVLGMPCFYGTLIVYGTFTSTSPPHIIVSLS
ncbi:hypothetical protein QR680_016689 [Steinernema hermaphroditum]|uniref:Uncharacterized protein n=1 Tax=Steinernema hermaphroditum TaxID=289476 RepID=A0AA39HC03_9BILA|nr:hypothetical protein QR680_016689 [Steinernema hermaphroditum]